MIGTQRKKALEFCMAACRNNHLQVVRKPSALSSIHQTRPLTQSKVRRHADHHEPPFHSHLTPKVKPARDTQELGQKLNIKQLPEVRCVVRARIPTTNGTEMFLHLYKNNQDTKEHLAIVFGNEIRSKSLDSARLDETEMDRFIRGAYTGKLYPGRTTSVLEQQQQQQQPIETPKAHKHDCKSHQDVPLVRIHSECYTGETVWSARCDCGEQLDESAHLMGTPGNGGIIIYLRQEGRGIGLAEKLKAYNLQDLGSDTVEANLLLKHPADGRSYELATAMLLDLGQREIRLLTNNPDKVRAVEGPNGEIVVKERIPMVPLAWRGNGGIRSQEVEGYLKAKIEKMSHML